MEYTLRDKIKINRPIVFLCGPYFNKDNKSDRRAILRDCFYKHYGNQILPLIIDDFLTESNIQDPDINIQLMEEIFASISVKTYIFLDTISAASELGLFMNHAFQNQIIAYIPKESDILNKKNVGYFAKDVILKMNPAQATWLEYRPSISRTAFSTDFVTEYYGFIGNQIPENIEQNIKDDPVYKTPEEKELFLKKSEEYPLTCHELCYHQQDSRVYLHTSVHLLFCIVSSLMYENYSSILNAEKNRTIQDFDVDLILTQTQNVFRNYLRSHGILNPEQLEIKTLLRFSFEEIVYHMVTFCYVYHCYSTYKGLRLVSRHMQTILEEQNEITGASPLDVFHLSEDDYLLLRQCAENPSDFYESFVLTKGGKKRELIKYAETDSGRQIRKLHQKMHESLRSVYTPSAHSYAYKKGSSIKECVEKHLDSNAFLKYDISKFFNSIDLEQLIRILESPDTPLKTGSGESLPIDPAYRKYTETILSSFYYHGSLPLGLVISPVLSDIYLHDFDRKIIEFCAAENYIYTRYADDILISQKSPFTADSAKTVEDFISSLFKKKKLTLNQKKKKNLHLTADGQHIKYIGINIVHFQSGNQISIGKQYIYDIAKEYLKYRTLAQTVTDAPESAGQKEHLFYEERRIAGKISFLKLIEGPSGWHRLKTRLGDHPEYYDGDRLIFPK